MTATGLSLAHLPPICLAAGLFWGLVLGNRIKEKTTWLGKYALQVSVVLLGFTVPFDAMLQTGAQGVGLTLLTLCFVAVSTFFLAKLFKLPVRIAVLVGFGTAICGGSAIAAAAPVVNAKPDEIAASLATVFILNAVGLFLFPVLGHWLALDPVVFGRWAAIAIHDTSSVVGAALSYSEESLAIATATKLTRALWIMPCCLLLALVWPRFAAEQSAKPIKSELTKTGFSGKAVRIRTMFKWLPWFIPGFVLAALLRTLVSGHPEALFTALGTGSKCGLSLSLLCIGAGVNRSVFARAGLPSFGLGFVLWILLAILSLLACSNYLG